MDGENLVRSADKKNKNLQVEVQVVTLEDNLDHPYFSLIELSKNNLSPIGVAKLEAPYTPYISNYWIKYQGAVVISFDMTDLHHTNTNSQSFFDFVNTTESQKVEDYTGMTQRIQNDQYNYSFICKISRFKQVGNKFVIYFEDLGWKFLQKVPKAFRDSFIAGQYLDDAFQAICEFMGVEFAYSIEDLHEYNFGADGYSIEKEGQVIEDVETVLSEWGAEKKDDEEEDPLDDPKLENPALINLDNENKNNDEYTNPTEEETGTTGEEETDENSIQDKIERYQAEFDQKVLDLFIGNTYYESNLIDPILNYNSITITPKSVADSSISGDSSAISEVSSDSESSTSSQNVAKTLDPSKVTGGLKGLTILQRKPSIL